MPSTIDNLAGFVAENWFHDDTYYDGAEHWVDKFWGPSKGQENYFRPLFDRMDVSRVIDLACGRGRHSWQMRDWPNDKTLVDVVPENIAFCKKRFTGVPHMKFAVTDGVSIPVADGSHTALFTYDSMVHFDHLVVHRYLLETQRVLTKGGMALFHHSNNPANPGGDYRTNPSWRNFMPPGLFLDYCNKAGLEVLAHNAVPWGTHMNSDCVTLVRKS